jgi:hypothetical protein
MTQQAFIAQFVPVIQKVSSAVTSDIDAVKILVSNLRQGVRIVRNDPLITRSG